MKKTKISLLGILFFLNVLNILGNNLSPTAITITNQYPNYPATPGDIYSINFLVSGGKTETKLTGFVDNNYNIDLSFLGSVNVKNLIYSEVQNLLKLAILKAYPGSIVNIMIIAQGRFKVTVLGEVKDAMIIDAMSLTTLAQVIKGITTDYASFRNIEVRSEGGQLKVYDLFKFKKFADIKQNPFLKPNDIITIRPYKRMVKIIGEVKRPGIYQLLDGDNLDTLINLYSDGFTKMAETSRILVKGIANDSTEYINADSQDLSSIILNDYDEIVIENKIKYNPKVIIQGAITTTSGVLGTSVSNKVPIMITSNSRVSTVLSNMDKMKAKFNLSSDLENAFILRSSEKIPINLKDIISNISSEDDIIVLDKDMIVVPFRQQQVYIAGSVNKSGAVPFIENRTAKYYIGLSGGYKQNESLFHSYTIRNMFGKKLKKDVIISPEDSIWVKKDHPMAYVEEYGGWAVTIAATLVAVQSIDEIVKALRE